MEFAKIICDKCGKYLEPLGDSNWLTITISKNFSNSTSIERIKKLDLCKDCANEFVKNYKIYSESDVKIHHKKTA